MPTQEVCRFPYVTTEFTCYVDLTIDTKRCMISEAVTQPREEILAV